MMQARDVAQLQEEWGEKPCNHAHVEKEYYLGADTGDYVCITCGKEFTSREEAERERQKQRQQCPDVGEHDGNSAALPI